MIPEWLKGVATEEGMKGVWLCEHGRSVVVCPDCRDEAIAAYRVAEENGLLDSDHVNKFQVAKSNGDELPAREPYFVLRGQDSLAPVALRAYLTALTQSGIEGEPIDHMQEHILEFMAWPVKKLPD